MTSNSKDRLIVYKKVLSMIGWITICQKKCHEESLLRKR